MRVRYPGFASARCCSYLFTHWQDKIRNSGYTSSILHENVNKARIDFISDRESRTAFTDVDGIATIANLPSGRCHFRISASGFATWIRDQDITVGQDRPLLVTLKPGVLGCEPHYWIEYDNRPTSSARGVVIDSRSGNGIRGVRIQLRLPNEKKAIVALRSQKKGVFVMPEIAPGRYRLRIMDDARYWESDLTYQDEDISFVIPTQDAPFITVKLVPKGSIEICR